MLAQMSQQLHSLLCTWPGTGCKKHVLFQQQRNQLQQRGSHCSSNCLSPTQRTTALLCFWLNTLPHCCSCCCQAPKCVMGPGTGLGAAQLFWDTGLGAYKVVPGEGAHATFAPR
jgi:hypothetical protein